MNTCQVCVHTNDKQYKLGELDRASLTVRKLTDKIQHKTKINPNALGQRIWDESPIYWTNDSEYKFISSKTLENIIKLAFLESSLETPLVIRQKNRLSADAQIRIRWLGKKDEPYFTSDSYLAYAWGPGDGLGGNVTMNADVLWSMSKSKLTVVEAYRLGYITNYDRNYPNNTVRTYSPLHTLKHEGGGHALGLNHITAESEQFSAIMYPFYNGLMRFGAADKNYLHSLYGESHVNEIQKEELLSRIERGVFA